MKSEVCKWRVPRFFDFILHDECSLLGANACVALTIATTLAAEPLAIDKWRR